MYKPWFYKDVQDFLGCSKTVAANFIREFPGVKALVFNGRGKNRVYIRKADFKHWYKQRQRKKGGIVLEPRDLIKFRVGQRVTVYESAVTKEGIIAEVTLKKRIDRGGGADEVRFGLIRYLCAHDFACKCDWCMIDELVNGTKPPRQFKHTISIWNKPFQPIAKEYVSWGDLINEKYSQASGY